MSSQEHLQVAIVGGGASGALTALNLLSPDDTSQGSNVTVTIFEATGNVGLGIAYATTDPHHLLNVRAGNMSAFADRPNDLLAWADSTGLRLAATDFLPRRDYGRYLHDRLAAAIAQNPHRLRVITGSVTDVAVMAGSVSDASALDGAVSNGAVSNGAVSNGAVSEGSALKGSVSERAHLANLFQLSVGQQKYPGFDAVVLAYGHPAPSPVTVGGQPIPPAAWYLNDPWDLPRLSRLSDTTTVVLVGTGLTAVDLAISLLGGHPGRRVVMVSRTGLVPRAHSDLAADQGSAARLATTARQDSAADQEPTAGQEPTADQSPAIGQIPTAGQNPAAGKWDTSIPEGPLTADRLATHFQHQLVAAAASGIGWRAVVDGVRSKTQAAWQALPPAEQRQFLTKYARQWEVVRHRMAPQVAARLAGYFADGQLQIAAGGIKRLTDQQGQVLVELQGGAFLADAVINCTGPAAGMASADNPLLGALFAHGLATADPLGIGINATPSGEVLNRTGAPVPGLYVIGPPLKGVLYESTAIPEIRVQAANLADRIRTL